MNVITYSGTGSESETYVVSKHIHKISNSLSKVNQHYFLESTENLLPGEVRIDQDEFRVGKPRHLRGSSDKRWSENFPLWSKQENGMMIHRELEFYKFLVQNFSQPFWLYGHTITSIVHRPSLHELLSSLPYKQIYAGAPLLLTNGVTHHGVKTPLIGSLTHYLGISGAAVLLSSDLLETIIKRADLCSHDAPNDVWLSCILHDVGRRLLPRYDISVEEETYHQTIEAILTSTFIPQVISEGYFHFRVNSLGSLREPSKRSSYDPKILFALALKLASIDATQTKMSLDLAASQHSEIFNFFLNPDSGALDATPKKWLGKSEQVR